MSNQFHWKKCYREGYTPWDAGKTDANLIRTVQSHPIYPCRTIDIGCGSGTDAIWLAGAGFEVTAMDFSGISVQKAKQKAAETGANCDFVAADFLKPPFAGQTFEFAYDRGCFHAMKTPALRTEFVQNVSHILKDEGLWLCLAGCPDGPPRTKGPPTVTAKNIVDAVENLFEIVSLTSGYFESRVSKPPPAWICLMRKRRTYKER